ncbi:GATA-type zinc finger protein 1 isoform X2 [Trematomus bernacchii]|nr:GATA-type zinc finger protein 1 isoform X2 [Trematomus bernacchii]XP_033986386.1 GATA-type zinc finger protein 1 isoform X2 [Trematomus bernacchii]
MSTRPRTQAAFIQGNQSAIEHEGSHSALVYLFQEVSKLASPIHNSFLDINSPSMWLHETSRQDSFKVQKEEEDAHSFQISNSPCQHNLSCMSSYNQMKKVKEESHSNNVTTLVEPHLKCSSPWKVLSLINLQCERLLHVKDAEVSDPKSVPCNPKLGHSIDKSSTAAPDVADLGIGGDCVSVECTLRPSLLIYGRQEIPQGCVKDSKVGRCLQSLITEKADTFSVFSVNRNVETNQHCFSSENNNLHEPFSDPYACLNAQTTFNSNADTSVAMSKRALDHNANLALSIEPLCDTQLSPLSSILPSSQSASLLFSNADKCQSCAKQDDKITAFKPEHPNANIGGKCPPIALLQTSSFNGETNSSHSETLKLEPRSVQKEESAAPSTQQWRTKTLRKQLNPRRSANIQDPDFQGVTFRMDTELDDNREQSRLLITSMYSKELRKSVRKRRLRTRTSQISLKTSSSDEESSWMTSVSKGKVCASCCTRKTPMWRDAEDGTPLCNACGIRYKKYRVRCVYCWHIPRKEGNSNSCCLKCGNFVRLTTAQRKQST